MKTGRTRAGWTSGQQWYAQGPLVDYEPGFVAAVYRNPILWGLAIALAVSGGLGIVTL